MTTWTDWNSCVLPSSHPLFFFFVFFTVNIISYIYIFDMGRGLSWYDLQYHITSGQSQDCFQQNRKHHKTELLKKKGKRKRKQRKDPSFITWGNPFLTLLLLVRGKIKLFKFPGCDYCITLLVIRTNVLFLITGQNTAWSPESDMFSYVSDISHYSSIGD